MAIGAAVLVVAGIAAALLLKPSGPDVRPEEEPAEISAPWVENVLKYDPLSDLDIGRAKIHSVTFLSTLDEAPEDAVDLSESGDGNVLGWVIGNSVYIAAEEGINGKVSCESLFEDCIALETVSFGDSFFTAETTSMESMFRGCIKLSQVDAENLDTGNVTTMKYMFFGWYDADDNTYWTDNEVSVLRHLDVSTWDVSRVEDMSFMFRYCNSMTRLDLSGWDTSSVVTMEDMFGCCTNLTDLNVSTWDVSAVEDMNQMFVACESLETLDVSDWDVSAVEDMTLMFFNCPKLTVDVSGWDVSSVTEFDRFMPDDKKVNGEPWENLFK